MYAKTNDFQIPILNLSEVVTPRKSESRIKLTIYNAAIPSSLSFNLCLTQSSVFKSRVNWGQWKDKKTLKYKELVLLFKSQTVAIYLSIIDKNMKHKNSFICLFFVCGIFPSIFFYTPYNNLFWFFFFFFFFSDLYEVQFFCFPFLYLFRNFSETFENAFK